MRTRASWCLLILLGTIQIAGATDQAILVRDGRTTYTIVEAAAPTEAEHFAATELADFLARVSDVTFPFASEAAFPGHPAIYVGHTAFAANHGVDFEPLGDEEWIIRIVDGDLILSGGRPRGTLYAVYEFLEGQLGIRFLTAEATHVPALTTVALPADLSIQASPAFRLREIYTVVNGYGPEKQTLFQVRRKINSFANAARQVDAQYGFALVYGSPYTTHVHHRYVANFPEAFTNHLNYFALTARGRRAYPRGQVCMSRPEVRTIFADALRAYIRRDRDAADKEGNGRPPPYLYALTPDDGTSGKCFCDDCLARARKYGSYAGVVLAKETSADHD